MSYTTVDARKVLKTAKQFRQFILDLRVEKDEANIAKIMQKRHFFSRRLFTRKEAIKWLENNAEFFGWQSVTGEKEMHRVEMLIALAQNGDTIQISGEDALMLWNIKE